MFGEWKTAVRAWRETVMPPVLERRWTDQKVDISHTGIGYFFDLERNK